MKRDVNAAISLVCCWLLGWGEQAFVRVSPGKVTAAALGNWTEGTPSNCCDQGQVMYTFCHTSVGQMCHQDTGVPPQGYPASEGDKALQCSMFEDYQEQRRPCKDLRNQQLCPSLSCPPHLGRGSLSVCSLMHYQAARALKNDASKSCFPAMTTSPRG